LRPGAEFFFRPSGSAQRRYEALRAYFVQEMPAAQVADQFGYSTASVHQMATLLRRGKLSLFAESKPGPKGPRKATGALRERVLVLRAGQHSVSEIAEALAAEGMPVSAQTVWQILAAQGLPRLPRRDDSHRGSPSRLAGIKAGPVPRWPADIALACDHAGLLLLFPAMAELGLADLVASCGYPSTRVLSAWQSIATLLLAKCARRARVHHLGALVDDLGRACQDVCVSKSVGGRGFLRC
jgi:transposase